MTRFYSFLLLIGVLFPTLISAQPYPYQDPTLSIEQRSKDLVSRMTLDEKVAQMMHAAPEIERLQLPAYNWWNECLHGVARAGNATVFPQAIGLASTFDENLLFRISTAISDEARAKYHAAVKKNNHIIYTGLTFWTPNVNIFRDPRWGRGQETYGEDPFLTARMGVQFVKGLQGDHPKYMKAAACAKHFAVHSGPERDRHVFNAKADNRDLYETYLPAFKALVSEANVEGVMCAYNRTNDKPCCGSDELLMKILRGDWKFDGYITSDCWALVDFHDGHKVTANAVESAALAATNGVNLNCGSVYNPNLATAVKQGLINESVVDSLLVHLLKTRFKLGMFDPDEMNPYSRISPEVINCEAHRKLAYEAAVKSVVLLENKNKTLPLNKDIHYLFVTGPNANNNDALIGNYFGMSSNLTTILEGIVAKINPGSSVQYKQGVLLDRENVNPIDWTTSDAQQADAIVAVMGISWLLEGEEGESIASAQFGDLFDNSIPEHQMNFLRKLRKGYDKPLIVVVTAGSPLQISEISQLADAVIYAWYPGEEGGNAVADILFGNVSPSGRLPITFVKSAAQLPNYAEYSMNNRTYRFMKEEPLYPFGYGLSYTTFSYSNLILPPTVKAGESVTVSVNVTNTGTVAADEVVQFYLTDDQASVRVPIRQLVGFKRVNLNPGETQRVEVVLNPEQLSVITDAGKRIVEPGTFSLTAGGGQPFKQTAFVSGQFTVKGKKQLPL